jgi:hypothetical protein
MGIFHGISILDPLKGNKNVTWIKIKLAQTMRPADGEQKAGAKNTDFIFRKFLTVFAASSEAERYPFDEVTDPSFG